jgi:hypothetical protein
VILAAHSSATGIRIRSDIRGGGGPPLARPTHGLIPEAKSSSRPLHRHSFLSPKVCRSPLRTDPGSALQASGIDFGDSSRRLETRRGVANAACGDARSDLQRAFGLGRSSGGRMSWGILKRCRMVSPGIECKFHNPGRFFGGSLKLPLLDRISGRLDQHRISSHNFCGPNISVCPNHDLQLDHASDVHPLREFRINRCDSVDYFSVRVTLLLSRAGPREQTCGKYCHHDKSAGSMHWRETPVASNLSAGLRRGKCLK